MLKQLSLANNSFDASLALQLAAAHGVEFIDLTGGKIETSPQQYRRKSLRIRIGWKSLNSGDAESIARAYNPERLVIAEGKITEREIAVLQSHYPDTKFVLEY